MNQRGFTLWELLVAMLVVGIVLGFGVPNFMAFSRNSEMASAVNALVSTLHFSRSEAVKRQVPITLCGTSTPLVAAPACDGGSGGFFAFTDLNDTDGDGIPDGNGAFDGGDQILVQRDRPAAAINTSVAPATADSVTYQPDGFIDATLNPLTQVLYCDERGNVAGPGGDSVARVVLIARTGRPQLRRDTASVAAAATATGGTCP